MIDTGDFAAVAITLYAAHYVGDYWVQTDSDAQLKGLPGRTGQLACLRHVSSYIATQAVFLAVLDLVTKIYFRWWTAAIGLLISGVTHYAADRREHGAMFWLARHLPGKAAFLTLGLPRRYMVDAVHTMHGEDIQAPIDNPTLGTGAWALDQAWHIFFGVFVAGMVISL